ALIHLPHLEENTPTVVMLQGINPELEKLTSSLYKKVILPIDTPFEQLFQHNSVIIGHQCALHNNIQVGDTIELLFIRGEKIKNRKVTFDSQTVTVGGIFNTGIDEFDTSIIYCSFDLLNNIFPNVATEQV